MERWNPSCLKNVCRSLSTASTIGTASFPITLQCFCDRLKVPLSNARGLWHFTRTSRSKSSRGIWVTITPQWESEASVKRHTSYPFFGWATVSRDVSSFQTTWNVPPSRVHSAVWFSTSNSSLNHCFSWYLPGILREELPLMHIRNAWAFSGSRRLRRLSIMSGSHLISSAEIFFPHQ